MLNLQTEAVSFSWICCSQRATPLYTPATTRNTLTRSCQVHTFTRNSHTASDLIGWLTCQCLPTAGWEPVPELLEVFQTEFALRLFWGQTGAKTERKERYAKFDRILTVLSNKLEPHETSEVWLLHVCWQKQNWRDYCSIVWVLMLITHCRAQPGVWKLFSHI